MSDVSVNYRLGVDIGSTTVKVVIIDDENRVLFSDYRRHFANIQATLASLIGDAKDQIGDRRNTDTGRKLPRLDDSERKLRILHLAVRRTREDVPGSVPEHDRKFMRTSDSLLRRVPHLAA